MSNLEKFSNMKLQIDIRVAKFSNFGYSYNEQKKEISITGVIFQKFYLDCCRRHAISAKRDQA